MSGTLASDTKAFRWTTVSQDHGLENAQTGSGARNTYRKPQGEWKPTKKSNFFEKGVEE